MRIVPGFKDACQLVMLRQAEDKGTSTMGLSFLTPPEEENAGLPEVTVLHWANDDTGPDRDNETYKISRHEIFKLLKWCERTLYVMDFPERYYEESSWRDWHKFNIPQKAGFTLYALQECEICALDEAELS